MSWTLRAERRSSIAGPCVVEDGRRAAARRGARWPDSATRAGHPGLLQGELRQGEPRPRRVRRGARARARAARRWRGCRARRGLPVLTDIHEPAQAALAAEVVDVLQIPAFLCRQTDLLVAAGRTGQPVNVKKGQWMAPEAMAGAVEKVRAGGQPRRGGHRAGHLLRLRRPGGGHAELRRGCAAATGVPVIFDATHAVQQPGQGAGGASGGQREYIPALLAAAAAAGADGFFLETHPDPERRAERRRHPVAAGPAGGADRPDARRLACAPRDGRAPEPAMIDAAVAGRIKLLGLDVDGVLTDNAIYLGLVDGQRVEFKQFDIQDGLAMGLARRMGLMLAWVSGRYSDATTLRGDRAPDRRGDPGPGRAEGAGA